MKTLLLSLICLSACAPVLPAHSNPTTSFVVECSNDTADCRVQANAICDHGYQVLNERATPEGRAGAQIGETRYAQSVLCRQDVR